MHFATRGRCTSRSRQFVTPPNFEPTSSNQDVSIDLDEEILTTAARLINQVKLDDKIPRDERASMALTNAEASGALPPLTKEQRNVLLGLLRRIVCHMEISSSATDSRRGSVSEDDDYTTLEDGQDIYPVSSSSKIAKPIKPDLLEISQALITLRIHGRGSFIDNTSPDGSVGNISMNRKLEKQDEKESPDVISPAESNTERVERAAQQQFMDLQINAFEPHARIIQEKKTGHEGVDGDAPSAGDGYQAVDDGL